MLRSPLVRGQVPTTGALALAVGLAIAAFGCGRRALDGGADAGGIGPIGGQGGSGVAAGSGGAGVAGAGGAGGGVAGGGVAGAVAPRAGGGAAGAGGTTPVIGWGKPRT
jgi:hypothetical protein